MDAPPTLVTTESVSSIYLITASATGSVLSTATGFLTQHGDSLWLITNRHVVTGLNQVDGTVISKTGAVPDKLCAWIPEPASDRIEWAPVSLPLVNGDQRPLWVEHPIHKGQADMAAVRLPSLRGKDFAYDILGLGQVVISPAEILSVVGYPFGIPAGGLRPLDRMPAQGFFGIWTTGWIASEPSLDHDGLPVFLLDSRTRMGQSGSPVIFSRPNGAVPKVGGNIEFHTGRVTELVGLYSGRINEQSDLGRVWKRAALAELVLSTK
jgi:hypothetical protein